MTRDLSPAGIDRLLGDHGDLTAGHRAPGADCERTGYPWPTRLEALIDQARALTPWTIAEASALLSEADLDDLRARRSQHRGGAPLPPTLHPRGPHAMSKPITVRASDLPPTSTLRGAAALAEVAARLLRQTDAADEDLESERERRSSDEPEPS